MKEVVFYLGAHKTGTTFCQSVLANNNEVLMKHGTYFLSQKKYWPQLRQGFLELEDKVVRNDTDIESYRLALVSRVREAVLECLKGKVFDTLILSHEDFSGSTRIIRQGRLYPAFQYSMQVLIDSFSGFDQKFIYTIRRQDEFIDSCVLQQIQQGSRIDIDAVLNNLELDKFCWKKIVDHIHEVSTEKPLILAAELKNIDRLEITRRIVSYVGKGIELNELDVKVNSGTLNPSLSDAGLKIAMAVQSEVGPEQWSKIRLFLRNNFSSATGEKAKILPKSVAQLLKSYYFERNKKILEDNSMAELIKYY
jgi:hypothetical protein